jgi:thioredoxin reductase (NADPH)
VAKPVIMCVDDDPAVLGAIERDLRARYRGDYRVMKASSGREALEAVRTLNERGNQIALFVSDERMPEMSGTELLCELRHVSPLSRRVLLTAYSDTEAAIRGINEVGLDHYLMKPWDPPEGHLYPVLDELLEEWIAHAPASYDGIRVAGARWCSKSYEVKDFLSRNQIPYHWIDVEQDPVTRALVTELCGGEARLPVVFFPDGDPLITPTKTDLAARIGMQVAANRKFYDLVIIGAGPAGLAAAVYAGSEGLSTLLIEQSAPGGQAGTSSAIENYLGFPSGISGADLARRAAAQAKRFGVEVLTPREVEKITRDDPYRVLLLNDGTEVSTKAVVLATGVAVRMLDAPGIEPLIGRGAYYGAAMTEAAAYRDQHVCVVGGANSAGQGALFFSRYASKVTILVRADSLSKAMSSYLVDRINAAPNIDVVTGHAIDEVRGTDHVEGLTIRHVETGETTELATVGVFVFIGASPRTEMVHGLVELDDKGYVFTGPDLIHDGKRPRGWSLDRDPFLYETSVPGIFAVGDLRAGSSKRVAAAVGEGSGCVGMVHRHLENV